MMLTGYTLEGSGRPRFRLASSAARRGLRSVSEGTGREYDQLPGLFNWTDTSTLVATSVSMELYLLAGDMISADGVAFFIVESVTASSVILTAGWSGTTVVNAPGFIDRSGVWLPHCQTSRPFEEDERADGGPITLRLSDGEEIMRANGVRLTWEFSWQHLELEHVAKLIKIKDHCRVGGEVDVTPHDDKSASYRMRLVDLRRSYTDDKLIGYDVIAVFRSVKLLPESPRYVSEATWGDGAFG
jgi:hypothetical protein